MFPMNRPGNVPLPPAPSTGQTGAGVGSQEELQTWNPPKRWAVIDGKWKYDAHEGIVRANGSISRYYNLNNDPEQIWYGLPAAERSQIILTFNSKGVSTRTPDQQINAFGDLLRQSNALGTEWRTTLNKFSQLPSAATGTGPSYRVSNPADLKAVVRAVYRETVGREANDEEANRFVAQYQQEQRQGQQGTVAAPSAEIAAQNFARMAAPKEAAAYGLLNYIGMFADFAKGVGQ